MKLLICLKYNRKTMKTNPNDSINARPYSHDERPSGGYEGDRPETFRAFDGLTKREYFAAMAMKGLLAGHYEYFTGNTDVSIPSEVAKYAIFNADALIEELNK